MRGALSQVITYSMANRIYAIDNAADEIVAGVMRKAHAIYMLVRCWLSEVPMPACLRQRPSSVERSWRGCVAVNYRLCQSNIRSTTIANSGKAPIEGAAKRLGAAKNNSFFLSVAR